MTIAPSPNVIAVDWSGAAVGAARKIWLAEARGKDIVMLVNGQERHEVAEYLIERARHDPNFIVGLDFAFSLPGWFLAERGVTRAYDLWVLAAEHAEGWLSACEPPFWGRPKKKRPPGSDDERFRKTERMIQDVQGIRPKSVFQIGGAGAVGTGSLRGMPILRQLHDASFSIWPFDLGGWPRVVEIWPRIFTGPIKKSRPDERAAYLHKRYPSLSGKWMTCCEASDDAFDAVVSALKMADHADQLVTLRAFEDPQALLEGWIWSPASRQYG